jgi:hypothetical protein
MTISTSCTATGGRQVQSAAREPRWRTTDIDVATTIQYQKSLAADRCAGPEATRSLSVAAIEMASSSNLGMLVAQSM